MRYDPAEEELEEPIDWQARLGAAVDAVMKVWPVPIAAFIVGIVIAPKEAWGAFALAFLALWVIGVPAAIQGPAERQPEGPVSVVSYRDPRSFQADAQRRLAEGWHLQGQSATQGRAKVGRKVGLAGCLTVFLGPISLLTLLIPWRHRDAIVATWVRDVGPKD